MKSVSRIMSVLLMGVILSGCCSIIPSDFQEYIPWCGGVPSVENHRAMFLYNNASLRMMNILSPMLSRDGFKGFVNQMKADGADMCYLFIINERDGGWTPYSFYQGNQIGGAINEGVLDEMKWRCEYVRDRGMGIIIVLRPDDSPNFVRTLDQYVFMNSAERMMELDVSPVSVMADIPAMRFSTLSVQSQEQYQRDAVKHFDRYASGYWVGLELDEYYNVQQVAHYAEQLQKLTDKPIGTHQVQNQYSFASLGSVDHCYFQYGWGKSPGYMQSRTAQVKAALGKPVIAAEYNKSSNTPQARAQGDAAMAGGAYATGNGRN